MQTFKRTVYLYHSSIESMGEAGIEVGDNNREVEMIDGESQLGYLLSFLTRRQRQVVELTMQGYTRKEIAAELGTCLQAIHQIVPRMRKRLTEKAGIRVPPRL